MSDTNSLPTINKFTEDERMLARFVVGAARDGGTMFQGRLYECMVARLLGGELAPRGVHPWDVRLENTDRPGTYTKIEVRSGTKSFKTTVGGKSEVDVWIFVAKSTRGSIAEPDGFYVASTGEVELIKQSSISRTLLNEMFQLTTADGLLEAVCAVAKG